MPELFALCLYWHGPIYMQPAENREYPAARTFAKVGTIDGIDGIDAECNDCPYIVLSASTIRADACDWLTDQCANVADVMGFEFATPYNGAAALGYGGDYAHALAPGVSVPLPAELVALGYTCTVVASAGLAGLPRTV